MGRFDPVARLAELRAASERITSNLLELESDPTVAMLDAAQLQGRTAQTWAEAREALACLFAAHSALKDVIERATRLTARPLLSAVRIDELQTLLDGSSIVVSDTSLGLADRGLLSESRRVVRRSADQLIGEMSAGYDRVKSIVVLVTEVWDEVIPRLRSERARSIELARLADDLGADDAPVVATSTTLTELSETVLSDPLAVDVSRVAGIAAEFDRIERELNELRAFVVDWPDHVTGARALLDRALRTAEACAEVAAVVNSRVALEAPIEPIALDEGLVVALDRVVARGVEDRRVGGSELAAWRRAVMEWIAEVEQVSEQGRSLVGQRDELRARLEAYSAKAARLGMLENPEVAEAFERARAELYTAPTDLGAAHALVARYQEAIAYRGERELRPR